MTTTVLVATWQDGLFVVDGTSHSRELNGSAVRGLTADERGNAVAIVDGRSVRRRAPDGAWTTIANAESDLASCIAAGNAIYVGTDDARVLRLNPNAELEPLRGFDAMPGRDSWYAGSSVIDGQRVGPPLGVRTMSATPGGTVLLVNVHVGGIPRSTDAGATWQPTIDVDSDVHEVRAHPTRSDVVIAASAIGLGISRDGGLTWQIESEGLHARYSSAVAFAGTDIVISASEHHFADRSAIYRRPIDGPGPLVVIGGGLPRWFDGIVDSGCIAARGPTVAVVDRGGSVYLSVDAGQTWIRSGLADTRHIGRIIVDPTNADVVYVAAVGHLWGPNSERGVFRTQDGGHTWARVLYVDDNTGATDIVMDL